MNTFHAWPLWLEGSTALSEPYQTASARPGPPALSHGNTFTASPVAVEPSETCTGLVQLRQPDAAEDADTYTWSCEGAADTAHTTNRLRALSIEATLHSVSGEAASPLAMWIRLPLFGPPPLEVGASRNVRLPVASGVPTFISRSYVPFPLGKPAAWNTLPVSWL